MERLNDDNFLTTVSNGITLVKFSAAWCGPCKTLQPILQEVQQKTGVAVFEVDIDECPRLVELFGIRAVPTVMIFDQGMMVGNPQVGARSLNTYLDLVEQVKNSAN